MYSGKRVVAETTTHTSAALVQLKPLLTDIYSEVCKLVSESKNSI